MIEEGFILWKTERKFRGKVVNHKKIMNEF
jgi:hypothetical protein